MMNDTSPKRDPREEFASELAFVMNKAMRLGLYRTMHKLHDAVREIGWEMADQIAKESNPPARSRKHSYQRQRMIP